MKIPKVSKVRYKSVKRFKARGLRRLERSLQLSCYEGYYPYKCNTRFLCRSCWFCGLKPLENAIEK